MLSIIIAILTAVFDQITKLFCMRYLEPVGSVDIIPGIFRFTYVENRGAAFGSFAEHRWVFMISTTVVIAVLLYAIYKMRGRSRFLDVLLGLLLGGGVGNMIDRIRLGYVVDFLDFCAFDFWKWVFNVADCAVTVGAVMLAVYILFFYDKDKKRALSENNDDE